MTYPYDLGAHSRTVTTGSADAQIWFDRGLVWTYGFHHEEAVACFRRAIEADPDCAMAHWGVAYAIGPNYNKPWEAFDEAETREALEIARASAAAALAGAESVTPVERALILALRQRYPASGGTTPSESWNAGYAEAMRDVYHRHDDDLEVVTLFAEALMNLAPWELWDLGSGEPADGAPTVEVREVLESALETEDARRHPGLLHMYVHLMEMSPFPEKALQAADWLRGLVPDSGHLQHMPTHIDVLCGHYRDVIRSNSAAIEADRRFLENEGPLNFYSLYRSHNYHFKLYGAMFAGRFGDAIEAADEMIATLPEEVLAVESPPMADWLESFVSMKMHVLIRFGRWSCILAEPFPENAELFCVTTAMKRYARGVAYAATGRVDEALEEQRLFEDAVSRVPDTRYVFNNTCLDILAVASEMLAGEIEYRRERYDEAFTHLEKSIELDDTLPYDEPWGWMQPTRHAYGALLLEQGRVEAAEAVYRADLGLDGSLARACQHPENVWGLHGFHECLTRLGKTSEAAMIRQRLDLALARTDVEIGSSCFCRRQKAW